MIIRKVICDRCGSEIKDGEQKDFGFSNILGEWHGFGKDLCENCVQSIAEFATTFAILEEEEPEEVNPVGIATEIEPVEELEEIVEESVPAEEPKADTPKKETKRVQIDDDEMRELFKSGMGTAKIAKHYDVSSQTVINHLKKMGLK